MKRRRIVHLTVEQMRALAAGRRAARARAAAARRIEPRQVPVGVEHGELFAALRAVGAVETVHRELEVARPERIERRALVVKRDAPIRPARAAIVWRDGAGVTHARPVDPTVLRYTGAVRAHDDGVTRDDGLSRRPRVLDAHLDWWQVNAKIEAEPGARRLLLEGLEDARQRPVKFRWRDVVGLLRGTSRKGEGMLECETFRLYVRVRELADDAGPDDDEPMWWELTWSNDALLEHGVHGAAPMAKLLLERFGVVREWRMLRFDPCVDMAGWSVEAGEVAHLSKHGHAKIGEHFTASMTTTLFGGEYRSSETTGWDVGRGSDYMLRCYRKDLEIKQKATPEKQALLEARWARGGRIGKEPVRRLEAQVRGAILDEIAGARDPMKLPELIDRVWAYALDRVRMTVPGATRTTRRTTDPRWVVLQRARFTVWDAADFVEPVEPVKRVRRRGGAAATQVVGCALSIVGAHGGLAEVLPLIAGLRVRKERGRDADDEFSDDVVHDIVRDVMLRAAPLVSAEIVEMYGARFAADKLATAIEAKEARFTDWTPPDRPVFEPAERDVIAARAMLARIRDGGDAGEDEPPDARDMFEACAELAPREDLTAAE